MSSNSKDKILYSVFLIVVLVGAILAAITLQTFIGKVVSVPAEAGYITTVIIDHRTSTGFWFGLFGLAFFEPGFTEPQTFTVTTAGTIDSAVFVFSCIDPNQDVNELYASTNTNLDLTGDVRAGTKKMLDDFVNATGDEIDSANATFIENISILLGSTNISGIPGVYTYVNELPNTTFFTGILNVSDDLVLVSNLWSVSQTSFKGSPAKYQKMIPVPNASTTWTFYADPFDNCPAASGTGVVGDGFLAGFAIDTATNLTLPNVTVSIGGVTNLSDASGFYNLTVAIGTYSLVGLLPNYFSNITLNVTINLSATTLQNMTLTPIPPVTDFDNGSIIGVVRDSVTNATLDNATVSIYGKLDLSNGTGNYTIVDIIVGTHNILAVRSGYDNFADNVTIVADTTVPFDIFMDPISVQPIIPNGTITGFVTDQQTSNPLGNVTVSVGGNSGLTNGSGFYNFTALPGTHVLVGITSGYDPHTANVTITSGGLTIHNFTMNQTIPAVGVSNGSVQGVTFDTDGLILTGVTVSVAGEINVSNETAEYFLTAPAGVHNLVALKEGFQNYVAVINVSEGLTTFHNITMNISVVEGLGVGLGTGEGAGAGSGAGSGSPPQPITEVIRKKIEYEVSIKRILKKIRIGNFIRVPINITNHKADSIDVNFEVEGDVSPLVRLDTDSLTVESDESGEVTLTLLGNVDPGVYEGEFIVSGDIEERLPINVLVYDKERLPIEGLLVRLIPVKKRVVAGRDLRFRVEMQNLLTEENFLVGLTYNARKVEGNNTIFLHDDIVGIRTSLTLLESLPLPADLEPGPYTLLVDAEYLGFQATHTMLFTVVEPFYRYSVAGLVPLWVLMVVVGGLGSITGGIVAYRKHAAKKKRYKGQVDFSTLPKQGPDSVFVGNIAETNRRAFFDINQFQVHTLIAGSTGSGKTVAAEGLAEALLDKGIALIVFDPTAQWSGFLRRNTLKKMFNLYPKFGMKKKDAHPFNGNVRQIMDAREMIEITRYIKPGEINVFTVNRLEPKDIDVLVANTVRQVFHANLPESQRLKLVIVFDEVHRLLPKFGGSGEGFLQIERGAREFRKWGVGLLLISQVLSDFVAQIKANINTEIQMRTRDENDMKRIKEEYGDDVLKSLVKAGVGSGMVENSAYNKGRPFFATFKPLLHNHARLTDEELQEYNKYNEIIDNLEYQIEQLEGEKVDVFDLKLEIKMALDKVKSGNFNMVNIYLEGLKPRIKGHWEKLGKQPKKRKLNLVSEEELKAEVEKAKKDREKVGGKSGPTDLSKGGGGKTSAAVAPTKPAAPVKTTKQAPAKQSVKPAAPVKTTKQAPAKQSVKPAAPVKSVSAAPLDDVKKMIAEATASVEKNKQHAKELYVKIRAAYKDLPPDAKKIVGADCLALGKKLI